MSKIYNQQAKTLGVNIVHMIKKANGNKREKWKIYKDPKKTSKEKKKSEIKNTLHTINKKQQI